MVVAENQRRRPEFPDKVIADKFFCGKTAEPVRKSDYFNPVDTKAVQHPLLFLQGSQQPEFGGILLQYGPWMRPECDDHALLATFPRNTAQGGNHRPVPDVYAIEKSRSYNHLTKSKSCLCGNSGLLA
jgi:hypothetical protein